MEVVFKTFAKMVDHAYQLIPHQLIIVYATVNSLVTIVKLNVYVALLTIARMVELV